MRSDLRHISPTKSLRLDRSGKVLAGWNANLNLHGGRVEVEGDGRLRIGVGRPYGRRLRTTLDLYENGLLVSGGNVGIGRGSWLTVGKDARLSIGRDTYLNHSCRLICHDSVSIG